MSTVFEKFRQFRSNADEADYDCREGCFMRLYRNADKLKYEEWITKKKENETDKEKIKRLEEENLYLKAELEYSKKLRAVVQARKNQQQKKK